MRKSNPGFTMVELIVAIAAAAIVMATALSFMLLGMRMENHSGDVAAQQQTARIVLTMAEKMAVSGNIKSVQHIGGDDEGSSWVLYGDNGQYLLQYLSADGTLRLGNSILMQDLKSAGATLSSDKKLFTLTIETQQEKYSTTVYCRNGEISAVEIEHDDLLSNTTDDTNFNAETTYTGRLAFLTAMCKQYGSKGEIKEHTKTAEEPWEYFSEWYIHQQGAGYEDTDWNKDTPWCACFVSWAAAEINGGENEYLNVVPYFADVDNGVDYFKNIQTDGSHWLEKTAENTPAPVPGDMVFFDWDDDTDPDHVGVVLNVDAENNYIYTIEGNSSGKVKVNRYPIDSDYILGYGVLAWTADPEHQTNNT